MNWTALRRLLAAAAGALILLGALVGGFGGYQALSYSCESDYSLTATQADPANRPDATVVDYGNLSPVERRTFQDALNGTVVGEEPAVSETLRASLVRYEGDHYQVLVAHSDCAGNYWPLVAGVGGLTALFGLSLLGAFRVVAGEG